VAEGGLTLHPPAPQALSCAPLPFTSLDFLRPSPPPPLQPWSRVVPNLCAAGCDLLDSLLQYDPAARICAPEALAHPYFMPLLSGTSVSGALAAAGAGLTRVRFSTRSPTRGGGAGGPVAPGSGGEDGQGAEFAGSSAGEGIGAAGPAAGAFASVQGLAAAAAASRGSSKHVRLATAPGGAAGGGGGAGAAAAHGHRDAAAGMGPPPVYGAAAGAAGFPAGPATWGPGAAGAAAALASAYGAGPALDPHTGMPLLPGGGNDNSMQEEDEEEGAAADAAAYDAL